MEILNIRPGVFQISCRIFAGVSHLSAYIINIRLDREQKFDNSVDVFLALVSNTLCFPLFFRELQGRCFENVKTDAGS